MLLSSCSYLARSWESFLLSMVDFWEMSLRTRTGLGRVTSVLLVDLVELRGQSLTIGCRFIEGVLVLSLSVHDVG